MMAKTNDGIDFMKQIEELPVNGTIQTEIDVRAF